MSQPTQIEFDFSDTAGIFSDLAPHVVAKFWEYHGENPHVFDLVMRFAKAARSSGRKHYGIATIFERIRWHMEVETKGDEFKINNNYSPCYSRLVVLTDPSFEGFFRTRSTPGTVRKRNKVQFDS